MGSSFCDPTREVCPFGAPIDTTLALINNIYTRQGGTTTNGPVRTPVNITGGPPLPTSVRNAPSLISVQIPRINFPGGGNGGITFPPININPFQPQDPRRLPPPLTPGRIPPGPQVTYPGMGGCGTCGPTPCDTGVPPCCPKGCHPDKKYGIKCVRNRRMNPLNHRALKRAIRRMDGFEGIAKKMGYSKRKRK